MSFVTSNLTFATGVQFCNKMFTTEEIGSLEVVKSNLFFTIYSQFSVQGGSIHI